MAEQSQQRDENPRLVYRKHLLRLLLSQQHQPVRPAPRNARPHPTHPQSRTGSPQVQREHSGNYPTTGFFEHVYEWENKLTKREGPARLLSLPSRA